MTKASFIMTTMTSIREKYILKGIYFVYWKSEVIKKYICDKYT